ncbi:MAG: FMN-binding protein [Candidatus Omnitrophica bacterium]|nr:FMN-binding protein [Candidatus Omnitrophota bacterium]
MKEAIRYGFTLALICAVAGGLLAGVNSLTKSRLISQAQAGEEANLMEVLPSASSFEVVKKGEEIEYYKGLNKENKSMGVVFKASAKGYSSTIDTLVGMLNDGTITAIKVVGQNETPGLGSRVNEADFAARFANRRVENLNQVQAITGATISSSAVIASVKAKAEEIKVLLQNER